MAKLIGSKYEEVKGLDIKEIAKRVRADIKKAGNLPKDSKVSVKNDYPEYFI